MNHDVTLLDVSVLSKKKEVQQRSTFN